MKHVDRQGSIGGQPVGTDSLPTGPPTFPQFRPQSVHTQKCRLTCANTGFPPFPQPLLRRLTFTLTGKFQAPSSGVAPRRRLLGGPERCRAPDHAATTTPLSTGPEESDCSTIHDGADARSLAALSSLVLHRPHCHHRPPHARHSSPTFPLVSPSWTRVRTGCPSPAPHVARGARRAPRRPRRPYRPPRQPSGRSLHPQLTKTRVPWTAPLA